MNRLLSAVAVSMAAALMLSACGVGEGEVDERDQDSLGGATEELSSTTQSYVQLRRDQRKCASPYCGGFFVHDVNRATLSEKYVRSLDFTAANLSSDDIQTVLSAADGEVVLKGKLGPIGSQTHTRQFLVSDAWAGMPGVQVAAGDYFYSAKARSPQINCFAAPCDNETATALNHSTVKTNFSAYSVDRVSGPFLDQEWLKSRIELHGALVAARFTTASVADAGFNDHLLDASQVFVHLPEHVGPCIMMPLAPCPTGLIAVQHRTPDRCVMQSACVTPGVCAMFMPVCPAGYTQQSWSGGSFACPQYACDPTFASR